MTSTRSQRVLNDGPDPTVVLRKPFIDPPIHNTSYRLDISDLMLIKSMMACTIHQGLGYLLLQHDSVQPRAVLVDLRRNPIDNICFSIPHNPMDPYGGY